MLQPHTQDRAADQLPSSIAPSAIQSTPAAAQDLKSSARWLSLPELNQLVDIDSAFDLYRARGFIVNDDHSLEALVRDNWEIALAEAVQEDHQKLPRVTIFVDGVEYAIFGVSHPLVVRVGKSFTDSMNSELAPFERLLLEPGLKWSMRIEREDAVKVPDTRIMSTSRFIKEGFLTGVKLPVLAVDTVCWWGSNFWARFVRGVPTSDETEAYKVPADGWSYTGLPPAFAIMLAQRRNQPLDSMAMRSAFMAACMKYGPGEGSCAAVVGALHTMEIAHFLKHPYPDAVKLAERFFTENPGVSSVLKNYRAPAAILGGFFTGASPYFTFFYLVARAFS